MVFFWWGKIFFLEVLVYFFYVFRLDLGYIFIIRLVVVKRFGIFVMIYFLGLGKGFFWVCLIFNRVGVLLVGKKARN